MPVIIESDQRARERSWIEVRLDRLEQNLLSIKNQTPRGMHTMAVVKANAYGHGLGPVAQALENKVDYLGVASVAEALALKELRLSTPIFLFGRLFSYEIPSLLQNGITLSVSSFEEAVNISEASETVFRRTPVHLKVDTGMGRMGISYRHALGDIEQIAKLPGIFLEGIYTHFPTAEQDDGIAESQLESFDRLLKLLKKKEIRFQFRHSSNSAASIRIKIAGLNMIRPGLMLYGIYPDAKLEKKIAMEPVLSLKSRIILIKEILPGDSVGYGRHFIATEKTRIAILPVGYSHGYPFSASGKAYALFHGKRLPLVGRISMDSLVIDLGHEPAKIGEEVTLLGENGSECIRAEEIASWANTIPYEIVTQLAPHLPRFYQSGHSSLAPSYEI